MLDTISLGANFLIISGLILCGFMLFAEYYSRGRWAKNITALLAGMGMLALAVALLLQPRTIVFLAGLSQREAPTVFLWISSGLLLAAIAAFGLITFTKPLRLWHERRIERELNRELPKIP